jgi:hypothetical protein
VWTGTPVEEVLFFAEGTKEELPANALVLDRRSDMRMTSPKPFTEVATPGTVVTIRRWPQADTRIEWQGERFALDEGDHLAERGDWQVFPESLPNIEVRLGAILALERIAQDSTATDEGRDHVRVMEILCAYIRENAPASEAQDHPYGEWVPLKGDATPEERAAHLERRDKRFGASSLGDGLVGTWAQPSDRSRRGGARTLRPTPTGCSTPLAPACPIAAMTTRPSAPMSSPGSRRSPVPGQGASAATPATASTFETATCNGPTSPASSSPAHASTGRVWRGHTSRRRGWRGRT